LSHPSAATLAAGKDNLFQVVIRMDSDERPGPGPGAAINLITERLSSESPAGRVVVAVTRNREPLPPFEERESLSRERASLERELL
jgi:hypothetical protein